VGLKFYLVFNGKYSFKLLILLDKVCERVYNMFVGFPERELQFMEK
jgi:hypothetical protein